MLTIALFFVGLRRAVMDIGTNSQTVLVEKLIGKKVLGFLARYWEHWGIYLCSCCRLAGKCFNASTKADFADSPLSRCTLAAD